MQNRGRVVVHIHHVIGIGDFHALGQVADAALAQGAQNLLAPANQHDLRAEITVRRDGAQHGSLRGMVGSHRIDNNFHK